METVVEAAVDVVAAVMGEGAGDCPKILVRDLDVFDPVCLPMAISKGLSLAIVVAAAIVKVPQIYLIVKNRSIAGVSLFAQYLELFLYSTPVAYNLANGYDFRTWGENFFLVLQVLVILTAMLAISKRYALLFLSLALYAGIAYPAMTGMVPINILQLLQGAAIPVQVGARFIQVYTVYTDKATGQLSVVTSVMNFLGCIARIFTVSQEHGDPIIMAGFFCSLIANGVVLLMFAIYPRDATAGKKKKTQ